MSRHALLAVVTTLGVTAALTTSLTPAGAHAPALPSTAERQAVMSPGPDHTLAAGLAHTCALTPDGKVKCWGSNRYGQFGNGRRDKTPTAVPAWVRGVKDATAITSAGNHTCALLSSGRVKCWGVNGSGELGNGSLRRTVRATVVRRIPDAVAVSAGRHHTCAVLSSGGVRCWGRNSNDQLGNDANYPSSRVAVPVKGVAKAVAVSTGAKHTCAVLSNGTVKCWGSNKGGQLGAETKRNGSLKPVTVKGLSNVTDIAAGAKHTCAISGARVLCWGDNSLGQLGTGPWPARSRKALRLPGGSGAVSLSAGTTHTCAVLKRGSVKCWGSNSYGEQGVGKTSPSGTASAVRTIRSATAVSAGGRHTCARVHGTGIMCWGDNRDSQLGHVPSPTPIPGVKGVTAVAAGRDHTCLLISGGTVKCLGVNTEGQLGNGTKGEGTWLPIPVVGVSNAVALAAGLEHTCAVLSDGTATCWGDNTNGQLGTGSSDDSATPRPVVGLTDVVGIAAASAGPDTGGGGHTCALRSDGTVWCWGSNYAGQLGNGTSGPGAGSPTPVAVNGISDTTAIAVGFGNTCALRTDGSLACWGDNSYGQLGTGAAGGLSTTPVAVSGITTDTGIGVGISHACARLADGTVRCWGWNYFGQLGTGTVGWVPGGIGNTADASATPVPVVGLSSALALATGTSHGCALLSDGSVDCWGWNMYGQVDTEGDPGGSGVPWPEKVPGTTSARAVAAGTEHTCALLAEYTVVCWGRYFHGAPGNMSGDRAPWPVPVTDP